MNRFLNTWLTVISFVSLLVSAEARAASSDAPNIVLIVADDLGWKDVGFHGSEIKTPHLDRLAAEGVRLEQFYVQPVCSPTRSALMTGRYPMRQGLQVGVIRPWARYGLPLEERTLADALKKEGYATSICGKWHLGLHEPAFLPTRRGFDHQFGHYTGALDYFTHSRMGGLDWHRNDKALRQEGYATDLIGDEAVKVVREHDPAKPLFLYVPFNAVHSPLQAPEEAIKKYAHIKDRKRRIYAAMTTSMDDAIGRIVAELDRRKMRENGKTLSFFCSDNGGPRKLGANNGRLRGGKGTLYEGGVRVPAVMNWPGRLEPGAYDGMMHVVDLYPTLLAATITAPPDPDEKPLWKQQQFPIDGMNMLLEISKLTPSPRSEILHNVTPTEGALRAGDWKLVWKNAARRRRESVELFNIADDPYEQMDLADKNSEKLAELKSRLDAYAKKAVEPRGGKGNQPEDFKAPEIWGEQQTKQDQAPSGVH